ncbi:LysR substrate-binding domain-containing protein [Cupriavidus sp. 30B13]|uniref:LysR substrate-binding domain-containing protein n=1 Tax=Cupriavidus sp. 30B13 TaxID=3384241 RepID=UPI003B8F9009
MWLDLLAGFGRILFPALAELRVKYPRLSYELALTDRMSDPVAEGWDIVVRIGELPNDGEMTVRKLCDLRLALYAAPAYLSQRAEIRSAADLPGHDTIVFRVPTGRLRPWKMADGPHIKELSLNPVLG